MFSCIQLLDITDSQQSKDLGTLTYRTLKNEWVLKPHRDINALTHAQARAIWNFIGPRVDNISTESIWFQLACELSPGEHVLEFRLINVDFTDLLNVKSLLVDTAQVRMKVVENPDNCLEAMEVIKPFTWDVEKDTIIHNRDYDFFTQELSI